MCICVSQGLGKKQEALIYMQVLKRLINEGTVYQECKNKGIIEKTNI
jgi:hypothetical protein